MRLEYHSRPKKVQSRQPSQENTEPQVWHHDAEEVRKRDSPICTRRDASRPHPEGRGPSLNPMAHSRRAACRDYRLRHRDGLRSSLPEQARGQERGTYAVYLSQRSQTMAKSRHHPPHNRSPHRRRRGGHYLGRSKSCP